MIYQSEVRYEHLQYAFVRKGVELIAFIVTSAFLNIERNTRHTQAHVR